MIKKLIFLCAMFSGPSFISATPTKQVKSFVIDHLPSFSKKSPKSLQAKQHELGLFFSPATSALSSTVSVVTDPVALAALALDALRYLEHAQQHAPALVCPPMFDKNILSTVRVKQTLQFIVDVVREDKNTGRYRLQDSDFINENFGMIKWHGDVKTAQQHGKMRVSDGKILLTHYMAFCCKGSNQKTKQHPYALYQMLGSHEPFSYTKQEVLDGRLSLPAYHHKVKPLVWLSREDLEAVMLQGVGFVTLPNGEERLFNVHVHNNIAYDQTLKNPRDQRRYWYFRETTGDAVSQQRDNYEHRKEVVFAGDVYNIGIGKLVMLTYQNLVTRQHESRLGIIADTGAAFHNNLYQLDAFAGMISSHQQLRKQVGHMLDTVNAYIIYKKDTHAS